MNHNDPAGAKPEFNEMAAAEMVGKRILIGITHLKRDGSIEKMRQLHGVIFAAERGRGIGVKLAGDGRELWLPPQTNALQPAQPGEYRLRSTGEVVVNPDFLTTWTVTPPDTE